MQATGFLSHALIAGALALTGCASGAATPTISPARSVATLATYDTLNALRVGGVLRLRDECEQANGSYLAGRDDMHSCGIETGSALALKKTAGRWGHGDLRRPRRACATDR